MTTGDPVTEETGFPAEVTRPRYYILDYDGSDVRLEFLNRDEVLIDGRTSGTHDVRPRDLDFVTSVGLPPLRARPRLRVGSRKRHRTPLDVYGNMFFSDRYKRLLFEFAAEDSIEAVSCDALDLRGRNAGPYWWLDVIRVIDAVDEDRSTLTRQIDNPFSSGDEVDRVRYMDLQDVRFRSEIVGNAHIFRLSLATQHLIIDGALADRIRASELSGVLLTPLQPPLPAEQADHLRFKNYPYWTNKQAAP